MSENDIGFSIVEATGFYSQIAGLLAGFVFTAIIILLSYRPANRNDDASNALYSLLVVFFSLIVASFLFALTSGEMTKARAFVMGLLASCIFSVSVVQMFLSIAWFFKVYKISDYIMSKTKWLFNGTVFIAAIYIIVTVGFTMLVKDGIDWKTNWNTFLWASPVLLFPFLGSAIIKKLISINMCPQMLKLTSKEWFNIAIQGCFFFTVAIAIYFGVVSEFSEKILSRTYPDYVKYILMFILGILFLLCKLSLPDDKRT